jgi:hypothetical protein
VTLSTDKTANIYYTIDGTTPTDQSTLYTGSFTLNSDAIVKVFAIDTNHNTSLVSGAAFSLSNSSVIVSDSFDRADNASSLGNSDTGQTWIIGSGTWAISSNQAKGTGNNITALQDIGSSNAKISVTVGAAIDSGIVFRYKDENNYFRFVRVGAGNVYLQKKVSGTLTTLQNISSAVAVGDILTVIASGDSIQVLKNGTSLYTTTDSSYLLNTKHGITELSSNALFNDFKIEHL